MNEEGFNAVAAVEADTSKWAVFTTRFQDPLDVLAQVAPHDPMVQAMLASRDRIDRRYKEIAASVPAGLSERQRQEYIAARVMGSIFSDVTTETEGTPHA